MSNQNYIESIQSPVSEEITIKEILLKIHKLYKYLKTKWLVIFSVGLLFAVLGYIYAYFKKPIYTAVTTFVLEDGERTGGALGQYAGLASVVGVDIAAGGGIFQGDNILELYKSRSMIQKVLLTTVNENGKDVLLIDKYIENKKLRKQWKSADLQDINFDIHKGQHFTRLQDSVLGTIAEDIGKHDLLVEKPDKKLSIVIVTFKSDNEVFSKDFNDVIVKKVNDFYVQTKTKRNLQNVSILQHQTDSVRSVLSGNIYSGSSILDATPNLNPTRQVLRAPIQKFQSDAESNKAILSELVKNLELAKLSLRKETPLIQVIDAPIYPLPKHKVGKVISFFVGGILGGILSICVLLFKKVLGKIMA